MRDHTVQRHLIIEILRTRTEQCPILRRNLRDQVGGISDRLMRRIIQEEIRPFYPIGSTSNGVPGYYWITTNAGLERYRAEILSRIHELSRDWKHTKQAYNRIHQPELSEATA